MKFSVIKPEECSLSAKKTHFHVFFTSLHVSTQIMFLNISYNTQRDKHSICLPFEVCIVMINNMQYFLFNDPRTHKVPLLILIYDLSIYKCVLTRRKGAPRGIWR